MIRNGGMISPFLSFMRTRRNLLLAGFYLANPVSEHSTLLGLQGRITFKHTLPIQPK